MVREDERVRKLKRVRPLSDPNDALIKSISQKARQDERSVVIKRVREKSDPNDEALSSGHCLSVVRVDEIALQLERVRDQRVILKRANE